MSQTYESVNPSKDFVTTEFNTIDDFFPVTHDAASVMEIINAEEIFKFCSPKTVHRRSRGRSPRGVD